MTDPSSRVRDGARPDPSDIRELSFSGPLLTEPAVLELSRALQSEADAGPVAIDCAALTGVTPRGLAALLELGQKAYGVRTLSLNQLSRALMLTAVQVGLSEHFAIYATHAACLRALARAKDLACAR